MLVSLSASLAACGGAGGGLHCWQPGLAAYAYAHTNSDADAHAHTHADSKPLQFAAQPDGEP